MGFGAFERRVVVTDTGGKEKFIITLRGVAVGFVLLGGWIVVGATLAGSLGDRPWLLDLFAHFRLQYAVLLLPALGVALLARRWVSVIALGAALGFNIALLLPLWVMPAQPSGGGAALRVVQFNVLRQSEAIGPWIANQWPDVVSVQEVDQAWARELDASLAESPAKLRRIPTETLRGDNFGLAVYVGPAVTVGQVRVGRDAEGRPRIEAELSAEGRSFTFVTMHAMPPFGESASALRREQLADATETVNAIAQPVLLVGDLNATRWSAPLRRLIRETALRDSAEGSGWQGTWPSALWWTGMIPIDHVLVSEGAWRVEGRRVGPALGSDHRAVVVDLVLVE